MPGQLKFAIRAELRRLSRARSTLLCTGAAILIVLSFSAMSAFALRTAARQGTGAHDLLQTDVLMSGLPLAGFVLAAGLVAFVPRRVNGLDRVTFVADSLIAAGAGFLVVFACGWISLASFSGVISRYAAHNVLGGGVIACAGAGLATALLCLLATSLKACLGRSLTAIVSVFALFLAEIALGFAHHGAVEAVHSLLPTVAASVFFSLHSGGDWAMRTLQALVAFAWPAVLFDLTVTKLRKSQ